MRYPFVTIVADDDTNHRPETTPQENCNMEPLALPPVHIDIEINNIKKKVSNLENEIKAKERKIKYLEAKLLNKNGKVVPCQSIYTQVSFVKRGKQQRIYTF